MSNPICDGCCVDDGRGTGDHRSRSGRRLTLCETCADDFCMQCGDLHPEITQPHHVCPKCEPGVSEAFNRDPQGFRMGIVTPSAEMTTAEARDLARQRDDTFTDPMNVSAVAWRHLAAAGPGYNYAPHYTEADFDAGCIPNAQLMQAVRVLRDADIAHIDEALADLERQPAHLMGTALRVSKALRAARERLTEAVR